MSRWRRDSDPPPPAHPAEGLDVFNGGRTLDPYGGAERWLEQGGADRWLDGRRREGADDAGAEDDDQVDDDEDPAPSTERDPDADAVAGQVRLEVLRELGPGRWTPACPAAFPCAVPEGEGPGECRYRLPTEAAFGCTLAVAEGSPLTQEEVGRLLGVGRARAGELEGRALRKVRAALERVDAVVFVDERTEHDDDELERPRRRAVALTSAPTPAHPGEVDSRASAAELRGILVRYGEPALDTAPQDGARAPQAEAVGATTRDLFRAVRALREAMARRSGGRRSC